PARGPCGETGPHASAGRTSVHGLTGCGGRNRFAPAVVSAYGIPLKTKTPSRVKPRTLPAFVATMARSGVATEVARAWAAGCFTDSAGAACSSPAAASPAAETPATAVDLSQVRRSTDESLMRKWGMGSAGD